MLLERIRAEKEELIKQGKIKRDKKEFVIFKGDDNSYYEKIGNKTENIDDQIPFDLPQGWIWCCGYSCFDGMESTKPHGDSLIILILMQLIIKITALKKQSICQ